MDFAYRWSFSGEGSASATCAAGLFQPICHYVTSVKLSQLFLQVLTLALACYRTAPQPAALALAKQFFIMYGREEGMVEPLR